VKYREVFHQSKALRDDVHGCTNAVEAGAWNRHLALLQEMQDSNSQQALEPGFRSWTLISHVR